tara:strand:- start:2824 stop:4446 length:1623 start_codon:yes stop_codon:yes gene_type:complete
MAISRSSFIGEGGKQPMSMRGMRRVLPKDTARLLKSVDQINKNLVAINKLLQKDATVKQQQQQREQKDKRIKAESLARGRAETAAESVKKGADAIKNALTKPLKKVATGLFGFFKPFLKFFTITFIGWFLKGVVGWFKKEKKERIGQIRNLIPKILTALTVAGGVLLALKIGIPVLMTTLQLAVTSIPLVLSALLNPVTWAVMLGAGLGILVTEGVSALRGSGARAKERFDQVAADQITDVNNLLKERKSGAGRLKIGNREYVFNEISQLIENPVDQQVTAIESRNGMSVPVKIDIKEADLRSGQLFAEDQIFQQALLDRFNARAFGNQLDRYFARSGELDTAKKNLKRDKDLLETNIQSLTSRGSSREDAIEYLKQSSVMKRLFTDVDDSQRKVNAAKQNFTQIQNLMKTRYNDFSPQMKAYLNKHLQMTADNLIPESLRMGPTEYGVNRIMNQLYRSTGLEGIDQGITAARDDFAAQISLLDQRLANIQADIDINVNPVAAEAGQPGELGSPGSMMPFDKTNPFIPFAKKTYGIIGVL